MVFFWVLSHLDNLSTHRNAEVKHIDWGGKVFVSCTPSRTTESMQTTGAGFSRSVHCALGNLLDT